MAYTKQQWIDNQTPLDASHMNHIEDGIYTVVNDLETTNTDLTNLGTDLQTEIDSLGITINELDGNDIAYDNTTSGLQATNVQGAIDEITLKTAYHGRSTQQVAITNNLWNEIEEIVLEKAGLYIIQFGAEFENNATGRRAVMLRVNGTATYYAYESQQAVNGAVTAMNNKIYINDFSANTIIKLMVYQTSGNNLNCIRRQLRAVLIYKNK